jgi:hypothetical protein
MFAYVFKKHKGKKTLQVTSDARGIGIGYIFLLVFYLLLLLLVVVVI